MSVPMLHQHRPKSTDAGHDPRPMRPRLIGRAARIRQARMRLAPPVKRQAPPGSPCLPGVHIPEDAWHMGTNIATGRDVFVTQERFEHQPHILLAGSPGTGKTTLLLNMIDSGLTQPDITWIILNPKGAFGLRARNLVLARGQAHRLEWLDANDERCPTYNPAHPNSLSWSTHAKQLREGIRQSTAMTSFDIAQQMGRILFMFLSLMRLFNLQLNDCLTLMRPKSKLRKQLIPKVDDPDLKGALIYFDNLPEARQDLIASSSLARLESFCFDPTIKRITCSQGPSLDIGDIIEHHKILIADIREDDPLRVDDCRLLGRFLTNDIVAHCFNRKPPYTPIHLVLDEAYYFMTDDLARAADRGREVGLKIWLACQYPDQFILEDGNTRIRDSIMKSIENRIIFRMADIDDCMYFSKQLFTDMYDPMAIKYQGDQLESEPYETKRTTHSRSRGNSRGRGQSASTTTTDGTSTTTSEGKSQGQTRGTQTRRGVTSQQGRSTSDAVGRSSSVTKGRSHTESHGIATTTGRSTTHSVSDAHGQGSSDAENVGHTYTYEGSAAALMPLSRIYSSNAMTGSNASDMHSESDSESEMEAETISEARADTTSRSSSEEASRTRSTSHSDSQGRSEMWGEQTAESQETSESMSEGENHSVSQGSTSSASEEESASASESEAPFTAFVNRRVPSTPIYWTYEEFLTEGGKAIHRLPNRRYFLSMPLCPRLNLQAGTWRDPSLTEAQTAAEMERVYTPSYYPRPQCIDVTPTPVCSSPTDPSDTPSQDVSCEEKDQAIEIDSYYTNEQSPAPIDDGDPPPFNPDDVWIKPVDNAAAQAHD